MEKWHVLPVNDVEEHKESIECQCNPKVVNERDGQVIVHNAFDGRELYEINDEQRN